MPGGFGTMDEIFEALALIQTRKIDRAVWQEILAATRGIVGTDGYD